MKTRSALWAAVACGAAAVALVGADLALNVDVRLEGRGTDGVWRTLSSTGGRPGPGPVVPATAGGNHFRLVAHNGLLWSTTLPITITASGQDGPVTLLQESWTLAPGAQRVYEFSAPNSTFASSAPPGGVPAKAIGNVQVSWGDAVGQLYASA